MLAATVALALAPSVSSMAARSPGSIRLLDPVTETAYADQVPFEWDFRPGSKVKTSSQVYLQATSDGYRWRMLSSKLPIRSGSYTWDTTTWPEGVYYVRNVVHSTMISSTVGPIIVDRTAPLTRITHPREGDVTIENLAEVYGAVVIGTTTLEAESFDMGSGVTEVEWFLDDDPIGSGTPYEYNFSMTPGQHVLTVAATDEAGNTSTHSVQLIAGPGPSLVVGELPEGTPTPPDGLPIEDPTLPDGVPTLPDGAPTPPSGLPEDVPPGGVPSDPPTAPSPEPPSLPDDLPALPAP